MSRSRLDDAAIAALGTSLPGWTAADGVLTATFAFDTYERCVAFAVQIALHAQRIDHHPDLLIRWGRVTVSWSTHDAGGITARDVEAARWVDSIART